MQLVKWPFFPLLSHPINSLCGPSSTVDCTSKTALSAIKERAREKVVRYRATFSTMCPAVPEIWEKWEIWENGCIHAHMQNADVTLRTCVKHKANGPAQSRTEFQDKASSCSRFGKVAHTCMYWYTPSISCVEGMATRQLSHPNFKTIGSSIPGYKKGCRCTHGHCARAVVPQPWFVENAWLPDS